MSAPGGPQMNKYEQLSSRGHQMPLAGGSKYSEVPCPECTSAGAKGGGGGGGVGGLCMVSLHIYLKKNT